MWHQRGGHAILIFMLEFVTQLPFELVQIQIYIFLIKDESDCLTDIAQSARTRNLKLRTHFLVMT